MFHLKPTPLSRSKIICYKLRHLFILLLCNFAHLTRSQKVSWNSTEFMLIINGYLSLKVLNVRKINLLNTFRGVRGYVSSNFLNIKLITVKVLSL